MELARLIEATGVRALAVHGRLTSERPRHDNRNHYIRAIADALNIPVIAKYVRTYMLVYAYVYSYSEHVEECCATCFSGGSGDIKCYEDIARFKMATGCSSVMIARAAQWNPSIFRAQGLIDSEELVHAYIRYVSVTLTCMIMCMSTMQSVLCGLGSFYSVVNV